MAYRLTAVLVAGMLALALFVGCRGPRLISTEQEISIGEDVAENVRQQYGVDEDPGKTQRITRIGERLVAASSRPDLPYSFTVLATDEVNAFAVMGGPVFVTDGLLQALGSDDDELAGVMGHEIAHVSRRHGVKQLEKAVGLATLVALLTSGKSEDTQRVAEVATQLTMQAYSRGDEKEADVVGVDFAVAAGFDGWGLVRFLEYLLQQHGNQSKFEVFLSSHPSDQNRIDRLSAHLRDKGIQRTQ